MAGPAQVNVTNVINPYEALQKGLGEAGSIYSDYVKQAQDLEKHNAIMNEQDRIIRQREFLKGYDPGIGVNNRGLTADAIAAADKYEAESIKQYDARKAAGEEVPSIEEFAAGLRKARQSLATSEQSQLAIHKDLLAAGFDPTAAGQYATALTAGQQSLASLQDAEQKRADALNAQLKEDREGALKFAEYINKRDEVRNTGKRDFAYGGTGGNTGGTAGGGKVTLDGTYTTTQDKDLHDFFRENLSPSFWGSFQTDANAAMDTFRNGLRMVNSNRAQQDLPPIPFEVASSYLRGTISPNAVSDTDVKPQTAAKFAGALEAEFSDVKDFRMYGSSGRSGIYAPERTFTKLPPEMLARMANNNYYTPSSTQALQDQLARRAYGLPDPVPAAKGTPAKPATAKPAATGTNSASASGKAQAGNSNVDIVAEKQRAETLKQKLGSNNKPAQTDAESDTSTQDNQPNNNTPKTPEEVLPVPNTVLQQWKAEGVSAGKIAAVNAYMEASAEDDAAIQRLREAPLRTDGRQPTPRDQQWRERALREAIYQAELVNNERFRQASPEIQGMIRQVNDVKVREFRQQRAADDAAARASRKELQRSQTINELEKQLENPALTPYERSITQSYLESLKNDPNMTRAPNDRLGIWADRFRDLLPR